MNFHLGQLICPNSVEYINTVVPTLLHILQLKYTKLVILACSYCVLSRRCKRSPGERNIRDLYARTTYRIKTGLNLGAIYLIP